MTEERKKWFDKYFANDYGKHDVEFDKYLNETEERLINKARNILNVTAEQTNYAAPIVVIQPAKVDPKRDVKFRYCADGRKGEKVEFDQFLMTVLLFAHKEMFYYQGSVDLQFDFSTNDVVGRVAYKDVDNVEVNFAFDDIEKPKRELLDVVLTHKGTPLLSLVLRARPYTGESTEVKLTHKEQQVIDKLKKVFY